MSPLTITPLYAAIMGAFLLYLSWRVIKARRAARQSIGHGKDQVLLRATRVHGNFIEYTPIILLLIGFAELMGAWWWLVHILGLALVAGRLMHAYGLGQEPDNFTYRVRGMATTFFALAASSAVCAALSIMHLAGLYG